MEVSENLTANLSNAIEYSLDIQERMKEQKSLSDLKNEVVKLPDGIVMSSQKLYDYNNKHIWVATDIISKDWKSPMDDAADAVWKFPTEEEVDSLIAITKKKDIWEGIKAWFLMWKWDNIRRYSPTHVLDFSSLPPKKRKDTEWKYDSLMIKNFPSNTPSPKWQEWLIRRLKRLYQDKNMLKEIEKRKDKTENQNKWDGVWYREEWMKSYPFDYNRGILEYLNRFQKNFDTINQQLDQPMKKFSPQGDVCPACILFDYEEKIEKTHPEDTKEYKEVQPNPNPIIYNM